MSFFFGPACFGSFVCVDVVHPALKYVVELICCDVLLPWFRRYQCCLLWPDGLTAEQSSPTFQLWLVWSVCFEDEVIFNSRLFFVTNNFSVAVAVISLPALLRQPPRSPRTQEGYIPRQCCHFEYPRVAASRSEANSRGSKASTQFARTRHNTTNRTPAPPWKAPAAVAQTVRQGH